LHVVIYQEQKMLLQTQALVLDRVDELQSLQLEYDTPQERTSIQSFLTHVAGQQGYRTIISSSDTAPVGKVSPKPTQPAGERTTLVRSFKNGQEFLRTYLASMEAGLVHATSKKPLSTGMPVLLRLEIPASPKAYLLEATGQVRLYHNNIVEIDLDELTPPLRQKIQQLCQQLVDEKVAASWQHRKKELAKVGVHFEAWLERAFRRPAFVVPLVLLLVLALTSYQLKSQEAILETSRHKVRLQNKEEKLNLRAADIQSLRLVPNSSRFEVVTQQRTFTLPLVQKVRLTEFQRQQLERLLVLQRAQ